jgi:hypothetical protein
MAHAAWQQRAIMAAASAFGPEDWPDINATQGNKEVECYGHGRGSGQKRPNSEEWSKMHDILRRAESPGPISRLRSFRPGDGVFSNAPTLIGGALGSHSAGIFGAEIV